MQSTDIPAKLPAPFASGAAGGFVRPIPVNSQIGITDGAASLHDGFPPLTAQPIGSGGIPPDIRDMNGILQEISAWTRWQGGGGPVYFDAAFALAVGGYPKWAVVQSAVTVGKSFISIIENNSNNPDSVMTGWQIYTQPMPFGSNANGWFMDLLGRKIQGGTISYGAAAMPNVSGTRVFPSTFSVTGGIQIFLGPNQFPNGAWAASVGVASQLDADTFSWSLSSANAAQNFTQGGTISWLAIGPL